ncbi:MAG TPA: hypothetical protein VGK92_15310 [Gaiellales bacterium]|jgi:hypothetical protein
MDERERVLLSLAGVRAFMGVLWLVNLLWKLPPDFGKGDYWGLPRAFRVAHEHAFSSPLRRFAGDVLIPHTTAFGWIVFLAGLLTGLSLVLGIVTRLGAALGLAQAIAITLLVANAPGEWLYGYLMFILLSALLLSLPVSRRLSLDDALGRDP